MKKTLKRKLKPIPHFKNEDAEREFWATHSVVNYFDWSKAERTVFPNLKPSTKTISIRVPYQLLTHIKILADKRDVPYQSLIKVMLGEMVKKMIKVR